MEELLDASTGMQRRKAKDEAGIIAEMVKDSSMKCLQATLGLFNILSVEAVALASSNNRKLAVIFKKCDPKMAGTYRPIAILPVMIGHVQAVQPNRMQSPTAV